jgi:hypothetical protein
MMLRTLSLLLLAGSIALACSGGNEDENIVQAIVLEGEDGLTVFDLLRKSHEVEYSKAAMGVFIKSIDGIENKGGHYWAFSVNGKPGKSACNKVKTTGEDIIKWEYK